MPIPFVIEGKNGWIDSKTKTNRKMRNLYNRARRQGHLTTQQANGLIRFLYGYDPRFTYEDGKQEISEPWIKRIDYINFRECINPDCDNEIMFGSKEVHCGGCSSPEIRSRLRLESTVRKKRGMRV